MWGGTSSFSLNELSMRSIGLIESEFTSKIIAKAKGMSEKNKNRKYWNEALVTRVSLCL